MKWLKEFGQRKKLRFWFRKMIRFYLYGALKKLYGEQTRDEQQSGQTKHYNGVGFNGADSRFLSSVSEFLIKKGFLTEKQKYCVRKRLIKYNKQLTRLANE